MTTLTKEDLAIFKAPFAPEEHRFLSGNAYIRENAITDRIEQVDPAWEFKFVDMPTRTEAGTDRPLIVCVCNLTIKGVTRSGVGMAEVTLTKKGDDEANEAEKSAATDALKRAARLFGIGRYLLNVPRTVQDVEALRRYLNGNAQKPVPSVGNPTPSTTTAQTPQNANLTPSDALPDWFDKPVKDVYGAFKTYILKNVYNGNSFHMNGSLKKHGVTTDGGQTLSAGWNGKTAKEAVEHLKAQRAIEAEDVPA